MEYFYIYKITCTAGSLKDHYYIGQHKTTNLDDGYKGSGIVINDYYKKYPNDYIKEFLCYCKDENELNEKEDFYVGDLYKTDPLCLNLRAGGRQPGISDEARNKISEAMKGKHLSEETRKKISEAKKGKIFSDEHRKKISESKKNMSDKTRNKISEARKGKHHSEETRKKISESLKGKHLKNINGKRVWY